MSDNQAMSGVRHNILVVDDIAENIDVVKGVLGKEYKLRAATNGHKALKIARSDNPPDLILLDIMMPEIDGLEVCRQLKADEQTRDIPIIFLSALGEDKDVVTGLGLGAVDYVSKPVNPLILKARVATHLSVQAGHEALKRELALQKQHNDLQQDVERMTRHDLKNPLGLILGYAEFFAAKYDLDEQQKEYMGYIESGALNMLDQINNSLNLFKIEQGTYQLSSHKIDLVTLLSRCINEQKALAKARSVELTLQCESEEFVVVAEELLCLSMFGNLLKNAVEASTAGQLVSVRLSLDSTTTPGRAKIEIHNPAEVPEVLKDTFFERYATSGKQQGTGIGTYSAKLLCEVQNGDIAMSSSAENGATITLRLPLP